MAHYDREELRDDTYKYATDPLARIPCPDCHDRESLTIAEDQPYVAALLSYCHLCDGEQFVSKARALAVLPHIAEFVQELRATRHALLRNISGNLGGSRTPETIVDRLFMWATADNPETAVAEFLFLHETQPYYEDLEAKAKTIQFIRASAHGEKECPKV